MPRRGARRTTGATSLAAAFLAVALGAPAATLEDAAPTELAPLVRAGRWEEVRTACAAHRRPWPAEVALAAARAERYLDNPTRAQEIVLAALPGAPSLAAALRLEGAEAALQARHDPWPFVHPLLSANAAAAQRRAAAAVLRRAWEELPLATLANYRGRPLPRSVRRVRDAITATRRENVRLAFKVLAERLDDDPAGRVAVFLASRSGLSAQERLLVGQALLTTGMWREADTFLSTVSPPAGAEQRYQLAFLRGRTAYRLGRIAEAAELFQLAMATATTAAERHAAAVQRARCAELLGDWEAAGTAWEISRQADPTAPAGWEGEGRASLMRAASEALCAPLYDAPGAAREVAAERLAAVLLARWQVEQAQRCLALAGKRSGRAQLLRALAHRMAGDDQKAVQHISTLLADTGAGRWREVALLLPPPSTPPPPTLAPTWRLSQLAALAARHGAVAARAALAAALAADPAWAAVMQGSPPVLPSLPTTVRALLAGGLERDAARLYPADFPLLLPPEAAWSACTLAAWDNGRAALQAGERLWQGLGGVPAGLLPASVTRAVLPEELTAPVLAAAAAVQVSPVLLTAIVRQESRFDSTAFSPAGARGLAQLVPETARRLGAAEEDLWRPDRSLELAARELARLEERFGARPAVLAAAYNAGETVVASWLAVLGEDCDEVTFTAAIPYQETSTYVQAVLEGLSLARHFAQP